MATVRFRAGCVAVVRRDDGRILAFERADVPGAWQLPQGGLRADEEPSECAWRELGEETGLDARHVRLVAEYPQWTVYELPVELRRSDRYGQVQRWFFFEMIDPATEPRPDGTEFRSWRWVSADELVADIVEFKRAAYRQVLR